MPKLPIPKLEDTCSRWLAAVTPLCNEEELANAKRAINEFATRCVAFVVSQEGGSFQFSFFFFSLM